MTAEKPSWIVEINNLTRFYGGENGGVKALDDVTLQIAQGEFLTVMGPSGSGKSTLLNMIGALDKPTGGQVIIDGKDLDKVRNKDGFRARSVGFIFQLHNLIPTLTARENVEVPMAGHLGGRAKRKRAEKLLEMVGLNDRMKHLPGQLSGGQRQRVAVARALANEPSLVLADEPTGSLDSTAGQELMKLLQDLNNSEGVTFIIVTHDPAVARQTNRVIVLKDGKVHRDYQIGSPAEEDLKMWQRSGLGQHIISGDIETIEELGLSNAQIDSVRELLEKAAVNQKGNRSGGWPGVRIGYNARQ